MALQALYLWQSRYNRSRAVSSLLCGSHRRSFFVYAYACALLHVLGMRVWRECCHKIRIERQHSSSSTTLAVFQALALVQQSRCMCVVGAQREIETRQHFHAQRNNQRHIVGGLARCTKHTAVAKAVLVAHTYNWSPLFDLRRPRDIKSTPSPRGTLYLTGILCDGVYHRDGVHHPSVVHHRDVEYYTSRAYHPGGALQDPRNNYPICHPGTFYTTPAAVSCRFQPYKSAQTNPIPDLTLTPTFWADRGWQEQPPGSLTCSGGVIRKKKIGSTNKPQRPTGRFWRACAAITLSPVFASPTCLLWSGSKRRLQPLLSHPVSHIPHRIQPRGDPCF